MFCPCCLAGLGIAGLSTAGYSEREAVRSNDIVGAHSRGRAGSSYGENDWDRSHKCVERLWATTCPGGLALAMFLQCSCHALAMCLPCYFHALAMSLPCSCHVLTHALARAWLAHAKGMLIACQFAGPLVSCHSNYHRTHTPPVVYRRHIETCARTGRIGSE